VADQTQFAEDVLKEMLSILGFKFSLEIKRRDDNIMLCIEGCDEASRLIGKEGHVLDSLQLLLSLIIYRKLKQRSNILVDVGGYREHRKQQLQQEAEQAAAEATETGAPVVLEPMNAMDRRIVHMALADRNDVTTESINHDYRTGLKSVQVSPA